MSLRTMFRLLVTLLSLVLMLACNAIQPQPTATPLPPTATQTPEPPTPTPTPALPTYSQILKTYPAGVELTCTDAEVAEVTADGTWTFTAGLICPGKSQLTVQAGGKFTVGEQMLNASWKSYGVKLTIITTVTIEGVTYQPGTLLTVDKDQKWVVVSSWD